MLYTFSFPFGAGGVPSPVLFFAFKHSPNMYKRVTQLAYWILCVPFDFIKGVPSPPKCCGRTCYYVCLSGGGLVS